MGAVRLRAKRRGPVLGLPHSLGRGGMRIEEALAGRAVPPERLVPLQRLEGAGQTRGVVPGSRGEIDADIVRFALLTPAVRRHEGLGRDVAQIHDPFADAGRDDPRRESRDPRGDPERRRGDGHVRATHGVARRHVDDLVRQDAGQLVLGVRQGQQPPRDVDVPVGKREGVRLRLIDDLEGVGDILPG